MLPINNQDIQTGQDKKSLAQKNSTIRTEDGKFVYRPKKPSHGLLAPVNLTVSTASKTGDSNDWFENDTLNI